MFAGAAATQQVRDLHVLGVLDLGHVPECYFIITEYHPRDLRDELERAGKLSLRRALRLTEDLLQGLCALEASGKAHGGIRPEGVLVAYEGRGVLDHLGTALRPKDRDRLTVTPGGELAGPSLYMAPEYDPAKAEGTVRGDLYALGCLLCRMVTGEPPFVGRTADDIRRAHAEAPRLELPAKHGRLDEFIGRLMCPEPEGRPDGAQEALGELRQVSAGLAESGRVGPLRSSQGAGRAWFQAKWTAAWTVIAIVLLIATVLPFGMVCRTARRRRAAQMAAIQRAPHRVAVLVRAREPDVTRPLPAQWAAAVRGLMLYRLAFYPRLESAPPGYVARLEDDGQAVESIRDATSAEHLLVAAYRPGFQRRNWTLVFTSYRGEPWSELSQASTESGADELTGLERSLRELLRQAAQRLDVPRPEPQTEPVVGAPAEAWAAFAECVYAEWDDRWAEAHEHAQRAHGAAPRAGPFAVQAAWSRAVLNAAEHGTLVPLPALPKPEYLPPEWAGICRALAAVREGDAEVFRERLGEHLAAQPRSARGYFLLGLWRLHHEEAPREALLAFRQAARLNPSYMPGAMQCVRLMAEHAPEQLDGFLAEYAEVQPQEEKLLAVQRLAARLRAGGS